MPREWGKKHYVKWETGSVESNSTFLTTLTPFNYKDRATVHHLNILRAGKTKEECSF
jgi:hypothetical protein